MRTPVLLNWGLVAFSAGYLAVATTIPLGTAANPGAGLYPRLVGVVLVVLALAKGVRSLLASQIESDPLPRGADLLRVLGVLGAMAFYALALPVLGHPLSSIVCFGAILRTMGVKSWSRVLLAAFLAAVLSWFLFAGVLQLSLPLAPLVGL